MKSSFPAYDCLVTDSHNRQSFIIADVINARFMHFYSDSVTTQSQQGQTEEAEQM